MLAPALTITFALSPFSLPQMNSAQPNARYESSAHRDAVFIIEAFQLRCGYCNDNAPQVEALARFYSYEPRVQFLDLGLDRTPRDYQQWIARHNPSFPVLMDAQRAVWGPLGGNGTPTTYVIGCDMQVKWKHVGVWETSTRAEIKRVIDRELERDCPR